MTGCRGRGKRIWNNLSGLFWTTGRMMNELAEIGNVEKDVLILGKGILFDS